MNREDLKNRPLYLEGIPEVKEDVIPHFPIPEGESMQTWHKWAPTGAILVIDEMSACIPPTSKRFKKSPIMSPNLKPTGTRA